MKAAAERLAVLLTAVAWVAAAGTPVARPHASERRATVPCASTSPTATACACTPTRSRTGSKRAHEDYRPVAGLVYPFRQVDRRLDTGEVLATCTARRIVVNP